MLLLGKKAVYSHSAESEILTQLNLSLSLSYRVMVGAALSREFIAHECAPTEISNMVRRYQASFHLGYWSFVDNHDPLLTFILDKYNKFC